MSISAILYYILTLLKSKISQNLCTLLDSLPPGYLPHDQRWKNVPISSTPDIDQRKSGRKGLYTFRFLDILIA